jgi:predicted AAA+ superfamily ATPase
MHSGTGRIVSMLMRPMSLFESDDSNGEVSLQKLFDSATYKDLAAVSTLEVERIAEVTARGGWPRAVTSSSSRIALEQAYNYVDAIINVDMRRLDGIKRDPTKVRALLQSVARNVSTPASLATIQADIAQDMESISGTTAAEYLDALKRLFVVEDLEAWNPAMRSKTPLRSAAKRHFVDPSIACAVIRATPERLLCDFNTFGYLFESLCVRDLRIYTEYIGGKVFYYRDKNDLEADAVISLNDGRWAPVEIKLGEGEVDEASEHLLKLKDKVDTKKMGEPAFCLILTGTQYAYQRKDGTLVVPIGTLAP